MTITDSARRLALVAIVAMLAALLPISGAFAQDPDPDPGTDDDREAIDLDGSTNVEYSVRWSQIAYTQATLDADAGPTEALIARDDVFADSLASGPLQGASENGTPLLLTPSDALDESVSQELERLGVDTVTILGNEDAVTQDVIDDLEENYTVNRLGGETRIETAIEIANEIDSDTAIVARAFGSDEDPTQAFADSLAAGGWAAEADVPVLLTQTEVLTGNTADHIAEAGYSTIIIVGGEAAVSADVEDELAAVEGVTVERIAGDNRFETAVAVADARGYANPDDAEGVILVDGQGANAWADGFPAANISGNGYPIVLSNSADDSLPEATQAYLEASEAGDAADPAFAAHLANVVLICGSTVPDGDEASGSDQCGEAADLLGATVSDFTPPGETGVTISDAEQGGDVTITITGAEVGDEIVISGCGIEETTTTVEEGDIDEDGNVVITETIPATQAAGDCDITVSVNGEEFVTTITVTEPAGNQTATIRPELVRARITGTVVPSQATPANPAGTTVEYTFDEAIVAANVGDYYVHTADNTRDVGDAVVGFTPNSTTVNVRFNDFDTAAEVAGLTLATVDDGAAIDGDGQTNPEGSAAIGTASTSETGAAGMTSAPDLVSVSGFRAAATPDELAVDFTFDEAVAATTTTGFFLVLVDGEVVECAGPGAGDTDPSGGTVEGGLGTTTITVTCDDESIAAGGGGPVNNTGGTAVSQAATARGGVEEATVTDAGGDANPLQTADISASGNTATPDLVSVTFQPAQDTATFTFDENVTLVAPTGVGFNIYDAASTEATGDAAPAPTVLNNQVRVTFAGGAVDVADAVGASVDEGIVTGATSGDVNRDDEVGVANTGVTAVTPGVVDAPQLQSVRVEDGTDAFNPATATYVFDTDVDAATVTDALFYLFEADGTRNTADTCDVGVTGLEDNEVECSFSATTDDDEVLDSVIGTVDFGAVVDGGDSNPEGAAIVTGTTGTPAT